MKLLLALSSVIVFWNVENFFDPTADSDNPSELSFTPRGERRWTSGRERAKARAIAKVLLALADSAGTPPDLIGLCEVENARCLRELVSGTALRKYGYRYVHFDSPDRRGIDCALLYRALPDGPGLTPSLGRMVSSRAVPLRDSSGTILPTRSLLLVEFDSLAVIVCHLPSKLGGSSQAEVRRAIALRTLSRLCDSLSRAESGEVLGVNLAEGGRRIIVIGDFNDTRTPESDSLMRPMLELSPSPATGFPSVPGTIATTAQTPTSSYPITGFPSAPGTIKFEGIWEQIDRAFVSEPLAPGGPSEHPTTLVPPATHATLHILALPFLTTPDKKFGGTKPLRTYQGPRYLGGVSDHYPIMVIIPPCGRRRI